MVSLGTDQDDEAGTGEPTVVGAEHRDAKSDPRGRRVGGNGKGAPRQGSTDNREGRSAAQDGPPFPRSVRGDENRVSSCEGSWPCEPSRPVGRRSCRKAG